MTATAVFLAGMTTMGFIVAAIFFMSFGAARVTGCS